MLSKYSVKKPFTVLVAVVLIIVLGVMSVTKMTPDLLPEMSFPYVALFTTYIGASPEEVESTVTKPIEQAMASLDDLSSVTSTSSENYSVVFLTFDQSANVDVAMLNVQRALAPLESEWGDSVGSTTVMELSSDLIPTVVAAVNVDGMDQIALSAYVNDTLCAELEGINGVASVTTTGLIIQKIEIAIDDDKLDALNDRLFAAIDAEFAEATAELDDARQQLIDGQATIDENRAALDDAQAKLNAGKHQANSGFADAQTQLDDTNAELLALKSSLLEQQALLSSQLEQVIAMQQVLTKLKYAVRALETAQALLDEAIRLIQENPSLTDEEKATYTAEITNSAEYQAIVDSLATIDAQLADYGLTRGDIDSTLATLQETQPVLEDVIAQIDSALSDIDAGLITVEEGYETLASQKASVNGKLNAAQNAINSGLLALDEGQEKVDEGNTQLTAAEEAAAEQLAAAKKSADLHTVLSVKTLATLLKAQNFEMPAGYVQSGTEQWMVTVGDAIDEIDALRDVALVYLDLGDIGAVRLSDIATLSVTDNSGTTYARINGESGVLLAFTKQSSYATATVADNITTRFAELSAEKEGLHFINLMDQGSYIHLAINSVVQNLIIGAVLAILILFLFLRDLRPTFIVGISIPISVLFALVMMYFSGVTMNIISMAGLAIGIGMLVDNSIVVIENIYRLRAEGVPVKEAAMQGAKQVTGAITASTLTTICVFVPILFVEGLTRQIFMDMVLTVTYSLLASLIVALTVIPAMVTGLMRRPVKEKHRTFKALLRGLEKAVRFVLRHRVVALVLAVLVLAGSAWASLSRGFSYFPSSAGQQISVTVALPENSTFEEDVALADQFMEALYQVKDLTDVGGMLGNGVASIIGIGGSTGTADVSELTIYCLIDASSGKNSLNIESEIKDALSPLSEEHPFTIAGMTTMDFSSLSSSGVAIDIYGNDLSDLSAAATMVADTLSKVDGIHEVSGGTDDVSPALHVTVDREKAVKHGLTVAQVYLAVAEQLTDSVTATSITTDSTSLDVTIVSQTAFESLDAFRTLSISVTKQDGTEETVQLCDVAEITETTTLASIARTDQRRYVEVSGTLDEGYNITHVTNAAQAAVNALTLPAGCSVVFAGENETILSALSDLAWMLALGVLIIYLIMVAQFQSLLSPFIVLGTVPLAFAGGFLGLLIAGEEVSIVAMIGMIMLVGVAVNNGIVLVDTANQLRDAGMSKRDAIVKATTLRVRPVLMTALTTILGLLPLAIGFGTGSEIIQPVAVVCIGGLTYATFTTLFIIPVLYDLLRRDKKPSGDAPTLSDAPSDADVPEKLQAPAEEAAAVKADAPTPRKPHSKQRHVPKKQCKASPATEAPAAAPQVDFSHDELVISAAKQTNDYRPSDYEVIIEP